MKKIILILTIAFTVNTVWAQKHFTKTGHVSFFSSTPVEDIEAHNYQATSVVDFESGVIVFRLLMKGFEFEKALMQEHFNEKYVESDEFPKATFKGEIVNLKEVNLAKNGSYEVEIKGDMTFHGVTNEVKTKGVFEVKAGKVTGKAEFKIVVAEYKINIPAVVRDKISKSVTISVDMNYRAYVK